MSLNIVDVLWDLFFPSKVKESLSIKEYTGTQSFLSTKSRQSIPFEFHQALIESVCFTPTHHAMNRSSLDSKMNLPHHVEPINNSLVSRFSKLSFPTVLALHECIRSFPNHSKKIQNTEYYLNPSFIILCEELEQHARMVTRFCSFAFEPDKKEIHYPPLEFFSIESPYKKTSVPQDQVPCIAIKTTEPLAKVGTLQESKKHLVDNNHPSEVSSIESPSKKASMPPNQAVPLVKVSTLKKSKKYLLDNNHPPKFSSIENPCKIASMPLNQAAPLVKVITLQDNKKHLVNNNCILNQELSNRKTKELQKRSKKHRRRQKKNKHVDLVKSCATDAVDSSMKSESKIKDCTSHVNPSRIASESSGNEKCDILCDFVTMAEDVKSVQVLLPALSSFVISVESADEDDSDWDNNSDCEWLTDCSEFEFTGLFVSNFSTPKTSALPGKKCNSKLSDPPSYEEDLEMNQLQTQLRKVNKDWAEATKSLDKKPKLATKVSFAPDAELVEVFSVEVYERKGEWEIYATERMRFKKRIDEIENILLPCFSREHREKVFQRLHQSDL